MNKGVMAKFNYNNPSTNKNNLQLLTDTDIKPKEPIPAISYKRCNRKKLMSLDLRLYSRDRLEINEEKILTNFNEDNYINNKVSNNYEFYPSTIIDYRVKMFKHRKNLSSIENTGNYLSNNSKKLIPYFNSTYMLFDKQVSEEEYYKALMKDQDNIIKNFFKFAKNGELDKKAKRIDRIIQSDNRFAYLWENEAAEKLKDDVNFIKKNIERSINVIVQAVENKNKRGVMQELKDDKNFKHPELNINFRNIMTNVCRRVLYYDCKNTKINEGLVLNLINEEMLKFNKNVENLNKLNAKPEKNNEKNNRTSSFTNASEELGLNRLEKKKLILHKIKNQARLLHIKEEDILDSSENRINWLNTEETNVETNIKMNTTKTIFYSNVNTQTNNCNINIIDELKNNDLNESLQSSFSISMKYLKKRRCVSEKTIRLASLVEVPLVDISKDMYIDKENKGSMTIKFDNYNDNNYKSTHSNNLNNSNFGNQSLEIEKIETPNFYLGEDSFTKSLKDVLIKKENSLKNVLFEEKMKKKTFYKFYENEIITRQGSEKKLFNIHELNRNMLNKLENVKNNNLNKLNNMPNDFLNIVDILNKNEDKINKKEIEQFKIYLLKELKKSKLNKMNYEMDDIKEIDEDKIEKEIASLFEKLEKDFQNFHQNIDFEEDKSFKNIDNIEKINETNNYYNYNTYANKTYIVENEEVNFIKTNLKININKSNDSSVVLKNNIDKDDKIENFKSHHSHQNSSILTDNDKKFNINNINILKNEVIHKNLKIYGESTNFTNLENLPNFNYYIDEVDNLNFNKNIHNIVTDNDNNNNDRCLNNSTLSINKQSYKNINNEKYLGFILHILNDTKYNPLDDNTNDKNKNSSNKDTNRDTNTYKFEEMQQKFKDILKKKYTDHTTFNLSLLTGKVEDLIKIAAKRNLRKIKKENKINQIQNTSDSNKAIQNTNKHIQNTHKPIQNTNIQYKNTDTQNTNKNNKENIQVKDQNIIQKALNNIITLSNDNLRIINKLDKTRPKSYKNIKKNTNKNKNKSKKSKIHEQDFSIENLKNDSSNETYVICKNTILDTDTLKNIKQVVKITNNSKNDKEKRINNYKNKYWDRDISRMNKIMDSKGSKQRRINSKGSNEIRMNNSRESNRSRMNNSRESKEYSNKSYTQHKYTGRNSPRTAKNSEKVKEDTSTPVSSKVYTDEELAKFELIKQIWREESNSRSRKNSPKIVKNIQKKGIKIKKGIIQRKKIDSKIDNDTKSKTLHLSVSVIKQDKEDFNLQTDKNIDIKESTLKPMQNQKNQEIYYENRENVEEIDFMEELMKIVNTGDNMPYSPKTSTITYKKIFNNAKIQEKTKNFNSNLDYEDFIEKPRPPIDSKELEAFYKAQEERNNLQNNEVRRIANNTYLSDVVTRNIQKKMSIQAEELVFVNENFEKMKKDRGITINIKNLEKQPSSKNIEIRTTKNGVDSTDSADENLIFKKPKKAKKWIGRRKTQVDKKFEKKLENKSNINFDLLQIDKYENQNEDLNEQLKKKQKLIKMKFDANQFEIEEQFKEIVKTGNLNISTEELEKYKKFYFECEKLKRFNVNSYIRELEKDFIENPPLDYYKSSVPNEDRINKFLNGLNNYREKIRCHKSRLGKKIRMRDGNSNQNSNELNRLSHIHKNEEKIR